MNRTQKKQARKENVPVRLKRLVRLRELNAPKWVIKTEQIALILNYKGRRNYGIGQDFSKCQAELYELHVSPLLE